MPEGRGTQPGSSVDERDAGASMGEAVVDSGPAAAIPVEVHLRDQKPATGVNRDDVGDVARTSGTLYTRLENDRRACGGIPANPVSARGGARSPVAGVAHAL